MNAMPKKIRAIYEHETGDRLDKYLVQLKIQELYSRSFIESLIDQDKILVNLLPVKKSYQLEAGDEISISLPDLPPRKWCRRRFLWTSCMKTTIWP